MLRASAQVATASASRYIQQLCKHFAHKIPTTFGTDEGTLTFPLGPVALAADEERLTIAVEAEDAERLAELQDVVARHLVRFAFRETLAIEWRAV